MPFKESDITFNPERHSYELPGIGEIPGVSKILEGVGFNRFVKGTELDLKFGSDVHKMVELDVLDDLDPNELSDGLIPPYTAFQKFKKDHSYLDFLVDRVEKPSFHPLFLYAGTADLPAWDNLDNCNHLIDVKTGGFCNSYKLQTSAYEQIERHWLGVRRNAKFKRSILFLKAGCSDYVLQPLTDKTDHNAWLNVLGTYNFMRANGYIK